MTEIVVAHRGEDIHWLDDLRNMVTIYSRSNEKDCHEYRFPRWGVMPKSKSIKEIDRLMHEKEKAVAECNFEKAEHLMWKLHKQVKSHIPLGHHHTYLTHIVSNWFNLADVTVFVNPSIGSGISNIMPDKDDQLWNGADVLMYRIGVSSYCPEELKWFEEKLGVATDGKGLYPSHFMSAKTAAIKGKSLGFYRGLLDDIEKNPIEESYLPSAWMQIFGFPGYKLGVLL